MCKDVECTFGILKGRWRVLRYGIKIWRIKNTDNIWKTCCALHNWLLKVDGLAEGWEYGVKSDWKTAPDTLVHVPFAIERLRSPGKRRDIGVEVRDLSGIGFGNDVEKGSESTDDENDDAMCDEKDIESLKRNGRIPIHSLSRTYFCKRTH